MAGTARKAMASAEVKHGLGAKTLATIEVFSGMVRANPVKATVFKIVSKSARSTEELDDFSG
jgi:hypothetical protein